MSKIFFWVLLVMSFIWLRSSYGKFSSGNFVQGLGKTLEKFASNNPYPIIKDSLNSIAIPNSEIFGVLTMWGELFTGIAILSASVYYLIGRKNSISMNILLLLGLLVGTFLNGVFWLASGWTSPSTDGLNLLMFAIGLIGIIFSLKGKQQTK